MSTRKPLQGVGALIRGFEGRVPQLTSREATSLPDSAYDPIVPDTTIKAYPVTDDKPYELILVIVDLARKVIPDNAQSMTVEQLREYAMDVLYSTLTLAKD